MSKQKSEPIGMLWIAVPIMYAVISLWAVRDDMNTLEAGIGRIDTAARLSEIEAAVFDGSPMCFEREGQQ